jgi:arabinose-5-phosphate isomerase
MLTELLSKQRSYTDYFFDTIDIQAVERIVERLLNCSGILFFSGIGKSGLIAKKIALTMVSTGTKAFFLSPTDALHGDLGMVSPNDIFIIFSKSGESDELIHLLPAIKNKGATIIGIVCTSDSRLERGCHLCLRLPFLHELCPFDMAPTMSTTSQQLFGDLLTVSLMRHKNFSLDEYALNHPSGRIGKRITLKVKDLMLTGKRIPLCRPDDCLGKALVELSNKRCGAILITNEANQLLGIFTDGDLRRTLQKLGGQILDFPVSQLMTKDSKTIGPDVLAWEAMKYMESDPNKRLMMLPVINENQAVLGLIHLHDIIQAGL